MDAYVTYYFKNGEEEFVPAQGNYEVGKIINHKNKEFECVDIEEHHEQGVTNFHFKEK